MAAFLPLDTARSTLRPLVAADADALAAYRSDPAVARHQSWATPYTPEQARRLIDSQAARSAPVPGEWIQIGIDHAGELIGDVAVGLSADGQVATIGYTLGSAHQGRGHAREAVGAVVDRLFAELDVHRVEASLDPANVASARLVEQLGFAYEGTARSAELVRGTWYDDARYGLLAADHTRWRSRPAVREVRLVPITPDNARAVLRLETHRSQQRFVATVAESFADAHAPDLVNGVPVVPWLRAVDADGALAGFVMLAERTAAHPEAYLWRLLVDRWFQRRGVGERVLRELTGSLRADGHTSLLVSWRPGPGSPEPFYRRAGFVPTGVVEDGEIEARLHL